MFHNTKARNSLNDFSALLAQVQGWCMAILTAYQYCCSYTHSQVSGDKPIQRKAVSSCQLLAVITWLCRWQRL